MRRSDVPTWQAFGASLKSMRMAHRWRLRPFAREVKIDPGYLCLIESGKQPPPSDAFLARMAEVLDVPAQQLLIMAGRLPPDVLHAFWQHPAIPPILSTIPGIPCPTPRPSVSRWSPACRRVLSQVFICGDLRYDLPPWSVVPRGGETMPVSFKGAHFPQHIILMGVRWYVAGSVANFGF
jgi:transcriptional regulator with XRE-family HTH domain